MLVYFINVGNVKFTTEYFYFFRKDDLVIERIGIGSFKGTVIISNVRFVIKKDVHKPLNATNKARETTRHFDAPDGHPQGAFPNGMTSSYTMMIYDNEWGKMITFTRDL